MNTTNNLQVAIKGARDSDYDPSYDLDKIIYDLDKEIDLLSSKADTLDYLVSAGSGLLTSLLDILWIGSFDLESGTNIASDRVNNFVKKAAEIIDNKEHTLKSAVESLEGFKLPSDANLHDFGGPSFHHLYDFSHHPTIVGLCFSLLTQFTSKSYGTNEAHEFIIVDIKESSKRHIGNNISEKVLNGTIKWFLHLVSDMAGSSNTVENSGGTGIPGPILSLAKQMSVLPIFKSMKISDGSLQDFISKVFHHQNFRFDLRAEIGLSIETGKQSLPVIANEYIVRSFYLIRHLAIELQDKTIDSISDLNQVDWEKIRPYDNQTISRMITIATGVFTTVNIGESVITQKYWLSINYPGVGRFAIAVREDVSYGLRSRDLKQVRNMYETIEKNVFRKKDTNLYERIDVDMNVDRLSLTLEQTEILYNIEYYKILNDIEKTSVPRNTDAIKIIKESWLNEWKEYISSGFSSFLELDNVKLHWYEKDELFEKIKENSPEKTWFRLILLEAMLFEPYYPLEVEETRKGKKRPSRKYKNIQGMFSGYSKNEGDKFLESFFIDEYYEEGYIKRLRKTYNSVLLELNEVLKGILKTVSITALITVTTVTTAGAFSGPIAAALVGTKFAGLSGAALTSASLAYIGGGAIAYGGAGMVGGTVAIVGGGAILGAGVGAGIGGSILTKSLLGKQNTILQSAKLLVSVREIFLNDEHDLAYSNSVYEEYLENIVEIEQGLVKMKLNFDVASKEEKSELAAKIKHAEESVEAMKVARKSMIEFISSFEEGLDNRE